jgi:hypothetical protein
MILASYFIELAWFYKVLLSKIVDYINNIMASSEQKDGRSGADQFRAIVTTDTLLRPMQEMGRSGFPGEPGAWITRLQEREGLGRVIGAPLYNKEGERQGFQGVMFALPYRSVEDPDTPKALLIIPRDTDYRYVIVEPRATTGDTLPELIENDYDQRQFTKFLLTQSCDPLVFGKFDPEKYADPLQYFTDPYAGIAPFVVNPHEIYTDEHKKIVLQRALSIARSEKVDAIATDEASLLARFGEERVIFEDIAEDFRIGEGLRNQAAHRDLGNNN